MERIKIEIGHSYQMDCESIVNVVDISVDNRGIMDKELVQAAGKQFEEGCDMLHGWKIGEPQMTKGYGLKADYVIHVAAPIYYGKEKDKKNLKKCYQACLDFAMEKEIHSISFPDHAAGSEYFPLKDAVSIACDAVWEWLQEHSEYEMEVIFCCDHKKGKKFRKYLEEKKE